MDQIQQLISKIHQEIIACWERKEIAKQSVITGDDYQRQHYQHAIDNELGQIAALKKVLDGITEIYGIDNISEPRIYTRLLRSGKEDYMTEVEVSYKPFA